MKDKQTFEDIERQRPTELKQNATHGDFARWYHTQENKEWRESYFKDICNHESVRGTQEEQFIVYSAAKDHLATPHDNWKMLPNTCKAHDELIFAINKNLDKRIQKFIGEIRKNSRVISQAIRTGTSFFCVLPREVNIKIAALSDYSNDESTSEKISSAHFCKP